MQVIWSLVLRARHQSHRARRRVARQVPSHSRFMPVHVFPDMSLIGTLDFADNRDTPRMAIMMRPVMAQPGESWKLSLNSAPASWASLTRGVAKNGQEQCDLIDAETLASCTRLLLDRLRNTPG